MQMSQEQISPKRLFKSLFYIVEKRTSSGYNQTHSYGTYDTNIGNDNVCTQQNKVLDDASMICL